QDRARGARARPDRARAGRGRAGPDALRPEAPREPAVEAPPGSICADPRSRPPDRDRSAAAASPGGAGGPSAPPAGFRPPRVAPDIRGTTMRTTGTGPGAERRLGDFEILDEIGRGGMGVVYRARQTSMGRLVALKVLPGFVGLDPDSVARFRREAEAAGRLSHPGIVPIFHVGEDQGIHFYAMELVEGPSLESLLDSLDGRVPERLLASLFEETALVEACPGL